MNKKIMLITVFFIIMFIGMSTGYCIQYSSSERICYSSANDEKSCNSCNTAGEIPKFIWNSNDNRCDMVEGCAGAAHDEATCVVCNSSGRTYKWNEANKECEVLNDCTKLDKNNCSSCSGYAWNNVYNACLPTNVCLNNKSQIYCSSCRNSGYVWDSNKQLCVNRNQKEACELDSAYVWVEAENTCKTTYQCANESSTPEECSVCTGYSWNYQSKECVLTSKNTSPYGRVSCGKITGIHPKIPEITTMIVRIIEVVVPIILIVLGSIDLFKGITAQKDDEIKKGQQLFIKRLIAGALVFFVIIIVKFLISIAADSKIVSDVTECIDCFISGVENCK